MGFLPKLCPLVFLLLSFLAFSFSLSSSSLATQLCSHEQATALLKFKNSFSIDESGSNWCEYTYPKTESWKEGTDCCSWKGITCDNVTGNVLELDLSCSNLYGSFPSNSSLFLIKSLQSLNLSNNDFKLSRIPREIGQFVSLKHLDLSFSRFSGQVPNEISLLSKLLSLDLSGYDFNSELKLEKATFKSLAQNLSEVRELFLSNLNMSSLDPSYVMNLSSSLIDLDLSFSDLKGKFPQNIFKFPNLKSLVLGGSGGSEQLTISFPSSNLSSSLEYLRLENMHCLGPFHSISNFKSLKVLSLSYCNLGGSIPASIGNLSQLSEVYLSSNSITGLIPLSLTNLTQLSILCLPNNLLSSPIPFHVGRFSKLRVLELSSNLFNGTIPSWIFTLPSLESLYLDDNQLQGQINPFQQKLLKVVNLANNKLQGLFPSSIFNLVNLSELDLSSNSLSGTLELEMFSKLQNLECFYLSYNNLSLRTNINVNYTLPKLRVLYLSSCNLSEFPNFLRESSDLEELDLSNNNMSWRTNIDVNYTFPKLKILHLSSCNLSEFPKFFKESSDLEFLSLSNNNMSWGTNINVNYTFPKLQFLSMYSSSLSGFPNFLRESSDLQQLDLSKNRIEGRIPEWMWNVGKDTLSYLDLSHNCLKALEQLPWKNIRTLKLNSNLLRGVLPALPIRSFFFSISNNHLSGEISSEICKANSLGILDLSHNKLSGMIPNCLPNLSKSLSVLNLQANSFHGNMPSMFSKGCKIKYFNLHGNQMEGLLPRSLVNCSMLEVLDIGNNSIKDTFPYWLESLPKLQVLVLGSNKFHGFVHNTIANASFPKLRVLDLSDNDFIGPLPVHYIENLKAMVNPHEDDNNSLQYMEAIYSYQYSLVVTMKGFIIEMEKVFTMFTSIDLSKNKFAGEIPKVIGKLSSLKGLNLSHNNLDGHIPHTLGNLTNLEWLDLSSNELAGRIPQELVSLTSLSFLDLSNNQLVGCILQGNQFNTFGNNSYEGNFGLYGFPLTKSCDENGTLQKPEGPFHRKDRELWEFGWKVVLLGYGCGLVFGLLIGYLAFQTRKPKWFVTLFDGQRNQRSRNVKKAQVPAQRKN